MWRPASRRIPDSHPIRGLFRRLTERGLAQARLSEGDLISYISDLLVRFVHIDELYRLRDSGDASLDYLLEIIQKAEESEPSGRRDAYRHVGDFSLFTLGLYPESLGRAPRPLGPDFYAEQGRLCYFRAAEIQSGLPSPALLRKLSDHFEECVVGLHWVREYTHDPFYQYMLRQFALA